MLLVRAFYCVFVRQSCNSHLFEGFSCEINRFSFIELPYISRFQPYRNHTCCCVKMAGRSFTLMLMRLSGLFQKVRR